MKLRSLAIAGFGRLAGTQVTFGDGLTVIFGPNEAGKSTIAAAIVASLYGLPRGHKELRRPWVGEPFRTTLVYELADGRTFEVQRDYERDRKGVRVYDRDGNDIAAQVAIGSTIAPGEIHLQLPHDAFVNAACVMQQGVAIDGERSATIATALARALDGGPKEDAALGAIERLAAARKLYVGTQRATVNNPLRTLREQLDEREGAARDARAARDRLAAVRERRATTTAERNRVVARHHAAQRELKALRAAELRARLEELREYREEMAARHAERVRYDDVANFPAERVGDLERAYYAWQSADGAAQGAEADAGSARLLPDETGELEARRGDAGLLDDVAFAALRDAARQAEAARARASAAANDAAAARRDGNGGRSLAGTTLVVALTATVLTVALAIAHWWSLTALAAPIAGAALAVVLLRARDRQRRRSVAEQKQRVADEALGAERSAAAAVGAVLERFGIATVDELARRRERLAELQRKTELAEIAAQRAEAARQAERRFAAAFDEIADELVPDALASRAIRHRVAIERGGRRRQRDGIQNAMAMLTLRRGEILRGADEFALAAERDALEAAGVVPAEEYAAARAEELTSVIRDLDRTAHDAEVEIVKLSHELELGEGAVANLAELEEACERLRAEAARLGAFERALALATTTLERLTHDAHQAFARRLEAYAAEALAGITAGRYGDIRVDPSSLAVRVRVPETGAIVELDALSAGTRDQIYLIVRFAMARMFSEGLETPPLLLDDPFAYWDDTRIDRCLPLVAGNAFAAQTILFTSSAELTAAAAEIGALRIDLDPLPVAAY